MNIRGRIISLVTFLGGLYYFLDFILPLKLPGYLGGVEFGKYNQQISQGFITVGAMAFALGLINLLYVHGSKILFVRKGFLNSLALLISLGVMMLFTLNEWVAFEKMNSHAEKIRSLASFSKQIKDDANQNIKTALAPNDRLQLLKESINKAISDTTVRVQSVDRLPINIKNSVEDNSVALQVYVKSPEFKTDNLEGLSSLLVKYASDRQQIEDHIYQKSKSKVAYDFLYSGLFVPLGSAMFALLGFYIISAGYRAFRVKSLESGLMMVAAVVVMLGQIPFYIYIWDGLPEIREWLLEVPSAAAFRAIKFGAAIAGLYMAIRMWLSIESSSFVDQSIESRGKK